MKNIPFLHVDNALLAQSVKFDATADKEFAVIAVSIPLQGRDALVPEIYRLARIGRVQIVLFPVQGMLSGMREGPELEKAVQKALQCNSVSPEDLVRCQLRVAHDGQHADNLDQGKALQVWAETANRCLIQDKTTLVPCALALGHAGQHKSVKGPQLEVFEFPVDGHAPPGTDGPAPEPCQATDGETGARCQNPKSGHRGRHKFPPVERSPEATVPEPEKRKDSPAIPDTFEDQPCGTVPEADRDSDRPGFVWCPMRQGHDGEHVLRRAPEVPDRVAAEAVSA